MKKKIPLLFIVGLVGVLVLFCGCTSPEATKQTSGGSTTVVPFDQAVTMTNGEEKISIEIGQPYIVTCEESAKQAGLQCALDTHYVNLNFPVKVKNIGNVGIKTRAGGSVTDYAGFKIDSPGVPVSGLYPGEESTNINSVNIGDLWDSHVQNKISHDLTLKITFGKDSAMWVIPTESLRKTPSQIEQEKEHCDLVGKWVETSGLGRTLQIYPDRVELYSSGGELQYKGEIEGWGNHSTYRLILGGVPPTHYSATGTFVTVADDCNTQTLYGNQVFIRA